MKRISCIVLAGTLAHVGAPGLANDHILGVGIDVLDQGFVDPDAPDQVDVGLAGGGSTGPGTTGPGTTGPGTTPGTTTPGNTGGGTAGASGSGTTPPQPPVTQTPPAQQPRPTATPLNVRRVSTRSNQNPGPARQQGFGVVTPSLPTLVTITSSGTDSIREQIAVANELCGWFPVEVRIDCVADRLRDIARTIPTTGEYAPVREALEEAVSDLREISGRNAAAGVTPRRFQAPHPVDGAPVRTSRLTAVAPDLQSQALQEALSVVEELETKLLRSAENSRKRQVHFQEIAASISSTKLLLRSS